MTREESIVFYKKHAKRLYNISLRIVRDSAQAEEIMQDTILKYISLSPLPGFGAASESAWLDRTCIRASIDALRKRKRELHFLYEYANEEAPEYFAPVEAADVQGEVESGALDIAGIRKAIDSLKDPYRLVLNLVLLDGLDYGEISGITGEREGTIRTQYSRARKMLKDILVITND